MGKKVRLFQVLDNMNIRIIYISKREDMILEKIKDLNMVTQKFLDLALMLTKVLFLNMVRSKNLATVLDLDLPIILMGTTFTIQKSTWTWFL